jgi:DNA processing protein
MSETPPGRPAQAWRFPSRNRVVAGLARMVVVVESHARGGSWHTVEAALRHGVEVAAVPGSVHSPASVGTNTLLHEGALPVRSAQDVLEAIGLKPSAVPRPSGEGALAGGVADGRVSGVLEREVLSALGWRPRTLDQLVEHSGLPLGAVVIALERLEQAGLVMAQQGWWVRRGDRRNR